MIHQPMPVSPKEPSLMFGMGVPVVIGRNGWEKIVDYKLNESEQAEFNKSADAVRNMNDVLKTL